MDEQTTELLRRLERVERPRGSALDHALCDAGNLILAQDAALSAGQADARRYQWLRDLKCCTFSLSRDEGHAINYQTFSDWEEGSREWYADVPADELERMRSTNTDWALQVYPDTPIGFFVWHAATLDAAIDAAIAASGERDEA